MEELLITRTINNIFNGADRHDWDTVLDAFTEEVMLDYASLSGRPGSRIKATGIIEDWSHFLPKFRFTLHLLSNLETEVTSARAVAFCKVQALHHLPGAAGGDLWTVFGSYHFELEKKDGLWKVSSLRFNLLYQAGNRDLPRIAVQEEGV